MREEEKKFRSQYIDKAAGSRALREEARRYLRKQAAKQPEGAAPVRINAGRLIEEAIKINFEKADALDKQGKYYDAENISAALHNSDETAAVLIENKFAEAYKSLKYQSRPKSR